MDSIDLLEELKLNDYYPQKLSFSEAIKLRGESQNGCHEQYGLEIVRKLLMFDSTAVDSVTTEINKRLSNTGSKETENKVQCVSDGARQQKTKDKTGQSKIKLHPMDLLIVVMNCCDDFLRQVLVEKMFANKLSIPILLPDVKNDSQTLLLFPLRSLVPELQDRIREASATLTDTLVDIRNPVVSFFRVGNLHRSKSKLVNDLLYFNAFNTFFHRDCAYGSAERLVSNGSIEAAWFQSSTATEKEFNCRFFTALNLRGDARNYSKQTQFLCQSSTLTVFMVDSFGPFKKFYENVLKAVDMSQTKIIVCCISCKSPDEVDEKNFDLWYDLVGHSVISKVTYDWSDGEKMSDVDFTNDLRETISKFIKPQHRHSDQMPTYAIISQSGKNFGLQLDEDKLEHKMEKASADEFVDLISQQPPDCKQIILPLQGDPWEKFGNLEREQRRKFQDKHQDEHFIAGKETEKRGQREKQCRSLIQQNEVTLQVSVKFHCLHGQTLLHYLNSCKIKLDARSRVMISNITEEYEKEKQENQAQQANERVPEAELSKMELKIANSAFGLEHILREHGQMYEAVISEEIRMREELKNAPLSADVIRNFPTIVAKLLLMGQPLELMDGDASNVPTTWLKAVLDQVRIMTNNAKVFVLSIIGVQSSGKSTLLNALFGLQFPVSAGRCTRGIYCHLVPVDKESLTLEYDYVLVVDTEGLRSSETMENSTFRDNELSTFAIGLADATIINMKGENWAEMKDILQIVAHGLVRIRKTKAELELMPRCMFVHQNVSAADATEKNKLGQEKQLLLLDKAIKAAAQEEGFTEITKFNEVIWYDPNLHSWYFPDLWNGRPPKARVSQDYTGKPNELRQYLMQLIRISPLKLTISSFFLRLSDLWNAMLHNDFVLCFRNTQEIISQEVINDRISDTMNGFKSRNKLEQTRIRELIISFTSVEKFRAEKEIILGEMYAAVEENFAETRATLHEVIDATDICASWKQKYKISLNALKDGELCRIKDEIVKDLGIHMKKLEYDNDDNVKDLKARLAHLEEVVTDKLNDIEMKAFENSWDDLIAENKRLVDNRIYSIENSITETIRRLMTEFRLGNEIVDWEELFKPPLVVAMPQITENDILQTQRTCNPTRFVTDFVYPKSYIIKANSNLRDARKWWDLLFQNQRYLEFNASHLEQIMLEVGQLLGILAEEHCEARPEAEEMCSILEAGYCFKLDYITGFIKFACNYAYNRSLENSKIFISLTDPLADIGERHQRSVSHYRLMTAEANIEAVSQQLFEYARRSFIRDLGELIKTEVCKQGNENCTFKSKRAFQRTILTDLGQKTHNSTHVNEEREIIFKEFLLYVEMAESKASEDYFLNVILKLLKDMLTMTNTSDTVFQKIIENNVGKVLEKAKDALRQAETMCKGRAREYVRIFKDYLNIITDEIDFEINVLSGFSDAVLQKIDDLYKDFLRKANSSFETLVLEENKAAIRPLFEKIMGCREKCPFCSAPCSQSLQPHAGDHRANHYPAGVSGTVDIWSLLETHDAIKEVQRKPGRLTLSTCQTMVGVGEVIRTKVSVQKYNKWYHRWFELNYQSLKKCKEIDEYENWDIPLCYDSKASLYWKWFMAQFVEELADHYEALCPKLPEAWKKVTWEEAKKSLDEHDFNFQFS